MTIFEVIFCFCPRDNRVVHPEEVNQPNISNNAAAAIEGEHKTDHLQAVNAEMEEVPAAEQRSESLKREENLNHEETIDIGESVVPLKTQLEITGEKKDEPEGVEENNKDENQEKQYPPKENGIDMTVTVEPSDDKVQSVEEIRKRVVKINKKLSVEQKEEPVVTSNNKDSIETVSKTEMVLRNTAEENNIKDNVKQVNGHLKIREKPAKVIKVKAMEVREHKKKPTLKPNELPKVKKEIQVKFKDPKNATKIPTVSQKTEKKVYSSEESQGEVILVSPHELNVVEPAVNNVDHHHADSATVDDSADTNVNEKYVTGLGKQKERTEKEDSSDC